MTDLDATLDALAAAAIAEGVCSAAAIAVGDHGREIVRLGRGLTRAVPDAGQPIDREAIFDLASLTKPMATAALAMTEVARGELDLAAPAHHWLGGLDPRITVAQLLGHGSGSAPHVKLYERLRRGDLAGAATARDALTAMARAPLEARFAARISAPLGLAVTLYASPAPLPAPVVGTVLDDRGLVSGTVHDENAAAAGGVAGHAGLFGSVGDVSRFAAAIVDTVAEARATPFAPAIVRAFLATSAAPDTSWRLGWDTPSSVPGVSHAGDRWPRADGVGHLGFTGTSLWLDLRNRRWVALLTNRVHPSRDRPAAARIKELRRAVGDAVIAALDP
ncbi:MAG: beta-lactamase family protein [Deltaproteobacteria bacterium]|nr:beta-lactamase family protein [Deltaproteobacteria bacterium]